MSDYKICVYAIAKNEERFAERWYRSVAAADAVYVLDTGSTDATVEILRSLGAHVEVEAISPWRFDAARNRSLALVPEDADLCVCVDLDEVFHPGWRDKMEAALNRGAQRVQYRYTWSFNPDGSEGVVFWSDKAHARRGWRWVNPVHEVLEWTGEGTPLTVCAEGVQLDHHADPAKSRGQYLPLLELAVRENPQNDRNMHYLGREYMFHGMWKECEETLKRHLALPTATWRDERCASMRFLARALANQGKAQEALRWHYRAIAEAPYLREPWLDAAEDAMRRQDWAACLHFSEAALRITERGRTYINEAESWGAKPYDLAALAAYYLGLRGRALQYGEQALSARPGDARLQKNVEYYKANA